MRLDNKILDFVKSYTNKELDSTEVYLFGSRVHDEKKGGDIDLLFLTKDKMNFTNKAHFKNSFFTKFGEQKLDVVNFTFQENSTFKDIILEDSVLICKNKKN